MYVLFPIYVNGRNVGKSALDTARFSLCGELYEELEYCCRPMNRETLEIL